MFFFVLSSQHVNTEIISKKTIAEYVYIISVGLEIET